MEKEEYILCAANWYDDGKSYVHQPINIVAGFVLCGRRHHNINNTLYQVFGLRTASFDRVEQGFLTSLDRFVDRTEAARIAFNAGQTKTLEQKLYSENLY